MSDPTPIVERQPAVRMLAMPADTNPSGDIFGGWLMSQMDIAGGIAAAARAKGRAVTVAVEGMEFHQPVYVGDLVSCYADVVATGSGPKDTRGKEVNRRKPEIH
jgi:acyl-CoA thioesterase YciA